MTRQTKHTVLASLLATCLATPIAGLATAKPTPEAAVLAAEKQWIDAVLKRDQPVIERLLADDLMYIHGDAHLQDKAAFIKDAMTPGRYTGYEFLDTTARVFGQAAIITHKTVIREEVLPQGETLYVTFVWAKRKGAWQLVHRHATQMEKPKAPAPDKPKAPAPDKPKK